MALLRGSLVAFDGAAYRAEALLDGSPGRVLTGLAVSRAIAAAEMVAGRRVVIDSGDQPDPALFVVLAIVA